MKVLIVGFAKIKYMPYLKIYLENLNRKDNEIHLVYWNRDEKAENLSSVDGLQLHEFKSYQEDEVSKISKTSNFIKFRKFVKSILKDNFDFIIVLQSVTAVLLFDVLVSKQFKEKFIYDYRDSTYENINIYKKIVEKLVGCSHTTFVSSRGFKKYLPESEKIKFTHNILSEDLDYLNSQKVEKISSEKIRIGFWGFLREEAVNLKIIEKISQDTRFELHYYGREQRTSYNLKKYVLDNDIKNVFFHGEYEPDEKYEFLKNTDIIHNLYSEVKMQQATSNKFYDGVIYKTPQICMQGSYMGKLVSTAGIGISIDPYKDDFTNKLYEYYQNINEKLISENCEKVLEDIIKEQADIFSVIKAI